MRLRISPIRIYVAMRAVFAIFVALALGRIASADALLSVGATAGAETCQQAALASASCSVSSTVYVPGGQFYSQASAAASLSFGGTSYGETVSLGPQGVGPLDYFLQGNWGMGQGIGLNNQASASLSATINLPSDSGDWIFYGATNDATDDLGGNVGPIEILTSNGTGWISGGLPSTFTIAHAPGTPFSVSIEVSDYVAEAQSSNTLDFELRMLDPVAVPEPASWALAMVALAILLVAFRRRAAR